LLVDYKNPKRSKARVHQVWVTKSQKPVSVDSSSAKGIKDAQNAPEVQNAQRLLRTLQRF
jgi:hypothetical protein